MGLVFLFLFFSSEVVNGVVNEYNLLSEPKGVFNPPPKFLFPAVSRESELGGGLKTPFGSLRRWYSLTTPFTTVY